MNADIKIQYLLTIAGHFYESVTILVITLINVISVTNVTILVIYISHLTMAPYKPYSAIILPRPHVLLVFRSFARRFWNHT